MPLSTGTFLLCLDSLEIAVAFCLMLCYIFAAIEIALGWYIFKSFRGISPARFSGIAGLESVVE